MLIPSIIEKTGRSDRAYDLPTKLLTNRIVYLSGAIDGDSADIIIAQLLWLDDDDPAKPIKMYIHSPGGCVYSGVAIKDVMDLIRPKVDTVALGLVASMGAYLLAAGTGTRSATPNSRIMVHSVSSGFHGTYHDQAVDFRETELIQNKIMTDISGFSKGKTTKEQLDELCQRDAYLSAQGALDLGLIDRIIEPK